jgi:GNAT superfamily N-acetyltransferase
MEVYFRKLTKKDVPAILNISKEIWEGDDYIPNVIYEWLDDRKSLNYGAFSDLNLNNLVGLGRVKVFDHNFAWLEGGRVKSSYQKQGIGREIMRYALNYVKKRGILRVQYDTGSGNEGSIALANFFGFQRKKSMELLGCKYNEIIKDELKSTKMKKISLNEAIKFYKSANIGPGNEICIGWAYIPLKYLTNQNSVWFRNENAIVQKVKAHNRAFHEAPNNDETWLILYGKSDNAFNLIQNVILEEDHEDSNYFYVFCHPSIVAKLKSIGFSYWDNEPVQVILFEKNLS